MLSPNISSKILEDAREKIAGLLMEANIMHHSRDTADQILKLSGTTDIECPDEATGDPDFATKTSYKWRVSVVLENGELPHKMPQAPNNEWSAGYCCGEEFMQDIMVERGYVQAVYDNSGEIEER